MQIITKDNFEIIVSWLLLCNCVRTTLLDAIKDILGLSENNHEFIFTAPENYALYGTVGSLILSISFVLLPFLYTRQCHIFLFFVNSIQN